MNQSIQNRLNALGLGNEEDISEDVISNEYRLLREGEIIREDDEVWNGSAWCGVNYGDYYCVYVGKESYGEGIRRKIDYKEIEKKMWQYYY